MRLILHVHQIKLTSSTGQHHVLVVAISVEKHIMLKIFYGIALRFNY